MQLKCTSADTDCQTDSVAKVNTGLNTGTINYALSTKAIQEIPKFYLKCHLLGYLTSQTKEQTSVPSSLVTDSQQNIKAIKPSLAKSKHQKSLTTVQHFGTGQHFKINISLNFQPKA